MSPQDALDPGPGGTFPFFPRRPDGSPDYGRAGYRDPGLPYGQRLARQRGELVDLTCPVVVPAVDPATLPAGVAR